MARKKKVVEAKVEEPVKEEHVFSTTEEGIEIDETILKAFEQHAEDADYEVQTTFSSASLDELNDPDTIIENVDTEDVEGIGAAGFAMRTTKPSGNKNFIRQANGGWNTCIQGSPTDPNANVLSNCVGYASGRFNEIINCARDTAKCTYTTLNCNAENFIERAQSAGLRIGSAPRVGAIICWQYGATLSGSDGAGHVEVVERINSDGSIFTSASNYGGTAFYNATRYNTNGRWGLSGGYTFRGFIYQPDDVQRWIDTSKVTPNVSRDTSRDQVEVLVTELRVRTGASLSAGILGMSHPGLYNVFEAKDADGYKWFRIADGQWVASKEGEWTKYLPKTEPTPTPTLKFKLGDRVVINGTLYRDADGNGAGATVSNRVTNITRAIPGKKCPYNTTGDLGWVYESSVSLYTGETFKVGDKVVPTSLVSYNGVPLRQYDPYYTISELYGDRAVLVARGQVWAAMNTKNLKHYN